MVLPVLGGRGDLARPAKVGQGEFLPHLSLASTPSPTEESQSLVELLDKDPGVRGHRGRTEMFTPTWVPSPVPGTLTWNHLFSWIRPPLGHLPQDMLWLEQVPASSLEGQEGTDVWPEGGGVVYAASDEQGRPHSSGDPALLTGIGDQRGRGPDRGSGFSKWGALHSNSSDAGRSSQELGLFPGLSV